MSNIIRLTENDLHNIVKKCVMKTLSEARNVKRIRITWLADMGSSKEIFMDNVLHLRYARNVGDEENVNHYVLSRLKDFPSYIEFEIIG